MLTRLVSATRAAKSATIFFHPLRVTSVGMSALSALPVSSNILHTHRFSSSAAAHSQTQAATMAMDEYVFNAVEQSPRKTALLMHGILGNKRNWRTPGKLLAKAHNDVRVVAMDHRGHGGSHGLAGANTVQSCAQDLHQAIQDTLDISGAGAGAASGVNGETPHLLAGHSFGGKVALKYLQQRHEQGLELPEDTWILDCLPGVFSTGFSPSAGTATTQPAAASNAESVVSIFHILRTLPQEFESPKQIMELLTAQGISVPVAQWLTSNCRHGDSEHDKLQLGFDLSVCTELFQDFCETDMWEFLSTFDGKNKAGVCTTTGQGKHAKIHFIRAGRNPLWLPSVVSQLEGICAHSKGSVQFHTMPHVGHWLHVEDVRGMIEVIQGNSSCLQEQE